MTRTDPDKRADIEADRRANKEGTRDSLSKESRDSFERAFYTLQTRAYLSENFTSKSKTKPTDDDVIAAFATSIDALLRKAHGTRTCNYNERLFANLGSSDTIISFNLRSMK